MKLDFLMLPVGERRLYIEQAAARRNLSPGQRFTDRFDSGDYGLHFTIVMLISAFCFTPRMKFGSIPVQIGNTEAQLLGSESETDSSQSQDGKA